MEWYQTLGLIILVGAVFGWGGLVLAQLKETNRLLKIAIERLHEIRNAN